MTPADPGCPIHSDLDLIPDGDCPLCVAGDLFAIEERWRCRIHHDDADGFVQWLRENEVDQAAHNARLAEELEHEPHALLRQWRYETSHPVERVTVAVVVCGCGQLVATEALYGAKAHEEPYITTRRTCASCVEVATEGRRATG